MMMDESASKEVCASGRPVRNRSYTPFLLPAGRESYGFKAVPSPDPVLQIEPGSFKSLSFQHRKEKKFSGYIASRRTPSTRAWTARGGPPMAHPPASRQAPTQRVNQPSRTPPNPHTHTHT